MKVMPKDLNKVMLIGRLAQDVEKRISEENGIPVVTFSVATNVRYKNKVGNLVEETEFHKCVAFWKIAELVESLAGKGKRVYIEWRLKTNKWTDENWQDRYFTQIIVKDFIVLSPKDVDDKINVLGWDWGDEGEDDIPF